MLCAYFRAIPKLSAGRRSARSPHPRHFALPDKLSNANRPGNFGFQGNFVSWIQME